MSCYTPILTLLFPLNRFLFVHEKVLVFESTRGCSMVAEHVEEQREALLAAQTVELVEMLREVVQLTFLATEK
ncbi:unnamed protein product [Choristocarpus tenellus]